MSASPTHSPERQPNEFPESEDNTVTLQPMVSSVSSTSPITRTVAIIKTHALQHRFDIEKRIQEASFEVRCPHMLPNRIQRVFTAGHRLSRNGRWSLIRRPIPIRSTSYSVKTLILWPSAYAQRCYINALPQALIIFNLTEAPSGCTSLSGAAR